MTKLFKSNLIRFIVIAGIVGSIILIVVNYSQIQNYQIKFRNDERSRDLKTLSTGVKDFVTEKNSCPRTSVPVSQSFLPELIIDSQNDPKGGVAVSSLEGIGEYINPSEKDPSGNPYFIGIYNNLIYLYTNDYELGTANKDVYYVTIEASLCNQILQ